MKINIIVNFFHILNEDAAPLQFLQSREGYVPVYIRHGDTPLHEINPELAVAFHENGISSRSRKDKSASDDQVNFKSINCIFIFNKF